MALEPGAHTWIDEVAELFGAIADGAGHQIRSYKQAEMADLPESITPEQMPCVVHHVRDCQPMYGKSAPTILFWEGVSQFHLFPDVKANNTASALPFFPRILAAAMGTITLAQNVFFLIPEEPRAIWFVTYRRLDGSDDHDGIQVTWTVKQVVTGQYTIGS